MAPPSNAVRSPGLLIGVASALIVVVALTAGSLLIHSATQSTQVALALDLAGRQRAHNQRHLAHVLSTRLEQPPAWSDDELERLVEVHDVLTVGGTVPAASEGGDAIVLPAVPDRALQEVLAGQRPLIDALDDATAAFVAAPRGDAEQQTLALLEAHAQLQRELDRAVDRLDSLAAERTRRSIWVIVAAMVACIGLGLVSLRGLTTLLGARERELAAASRFRRLLDDSADSIIGIDERGQIELANPAALRTFGYTAEELLGRNVRMLMPEPHRGQHDGYLAHHLATGERRIIGVGREVEAVHKDGTILPVHLSVSSTTEGKRTTFVGILRDMSAERAAREDAARRELEARLLHEATVRASESADIDSALQACARAVCEATGWPLGHIYYVDPDDPDQLRPSGLWARSTTGDFRRFVEATEATTFRRGIGLPGSILATGKPDWIVDVHQEASFVRAERLDGVEVRGGFGFPVIVDGEVFAVLEFFSLEPMAESRALLGAAEPLGVQVGRIIERTRSRQAITRARDEAEAANRAKSSFLATMSHELRTPLNSVIGFSNILRKNKTGNLTDGQLTFVERITANGTHLLGLINEILDISKIETGELAIHLADADVGSVLDGVLRLQESIAKERGLTLQAEVPAELQSIHTDEGRLRQILINLVGNALKFTESGGVTVRIISHPGTHQPACIEVQDTGPGIAPEDQATVFLPFRQLDGSTTRTYGGTGLGLAICQRLAVLLDYRLELDSEVGVGSTFRIVLPPPSSSPAPSPPRPTPTAADVPEPAPPTASSLGRRVLVIDDDADARAVLGDQLDELGCEVRFATQGDEGLRIARAWRPDAITLDLMMPRVNGWETFARLRSDAQLRDVPVLIVSMIAGEARATLVGAIDYLQKPVDPADLARALSTVRPGTCRALVVDDDRDTRFVLAEMLEDEGWQVAEVEDGRQAMEATARFVPDLIVLDLMMPVMDGGQFLAWLRQQPALREVPVWVVSAKDLDLAELDALRSQANEIIPKGASMQEELRQALRQLT